MKAYTRKIKNGSDITLHMLEHEIDRMTLAAVLGGTRWLGPSKSTLGIQQSRWVASNVPFSEVVGDGILQTFPEKFKSCFTNFSKSIFQVEENVQLFSLKTFETLTYSTM